jgi:hypothetical protein
VVAGILYGLWKFRHERRRSAESRPAALSA